MVTPQCLYLSYTHKRMAAEKTALVADFLQFLTTSTAKYFNNFYGGYHNKIVIPLMGRIVNKTGYCTIASLATLKTGNAPSLIVCNVQLLLTKTLLYAELRL